MNAKFRHTVLLWVMHMSLASAYTAEPGLYICLVWARNVGPLNAGCMTYVHDKSNGSEHFSLPLNKRNINTQCRILLWWIQLTQICIMYSIIAVYALPSRVATMPAVRYDVNGGLPTCLWYHSLYTRIIWLLLCFWNICKPDMVPVSIYVE